MKEFMRIAISLLLCLSFVAVIPTVSFAALVGDMDGDGKVTTVDARIVLKIAAGHISPTTSQKKLADMDGNGTISVEDARLTLIAATGVESDEDYIQKLIDKGFPKSYVEDLLALHKKYPQWEFEPMITNLDWQTAVNGERTPHKKQLIENDVSSSYKCSCSSCNGVIQEGGVWVSASEAAVKYYLDPRNFLNEQYIFQFEKNVYHSSQTIEAIESILKPTWMYKSNITYYDALGNEKTYKKNGEAVTYSQAILTAAKDSGLSAYYIASKIVQEVGGTKPTAAAASGKSSPYYGIYNYYNIGAYTGAGDGLKWANGNMKAVGSTKIYKTASTSADVVATVSSGTELYYIGKSGDFYRVSATKNGTKYTGYVASDNAYIGTSYGRPWNNPYKTIYNGALYIDESFSKTQFTGYLQKFNVNPESEYLYSHEYMANVRAAAFEAYSTYKAYSENSILDNRKVFSIPVFKNMPNGDILKSEMFLKGSPGISDASSTTDSITLSWSAMDTATGYQVLRYNYQDGKYERIKVTTATSYTDTGLSAGSSYLYRVKAYRKNSKGEYEYSLNSDKFYGATKPAKPTGLAKTSVGDNAITIKWSAVECTGYYIYRYDDLSGAYSRIGSTTKTSYSDTALISGTEYTYKIRAYKTTSSMTATSSYSATLKLTTTGTAPKKMGVVNVSDWLNIRSKPDTSADVVVQAPDGQKLYILSQSGDWYKVTFILNGKTYTGYAHSDYVVASALKEACPYTEPTTTVSQGDSGNGVKWVQWYLYKLGYLNKSDIDGDFGPTTLSAVKEFQKDNSLTVDGLVGSGTRTALKNEYGK